MNQSTKTLFTINAALYFAYALGAFFVIPGFEELFRSFEVKLEGVSLWYLDNSVIAPCITLPPPSM